MKLDAKFTSLGIDFEILEADMVWSNYEKQLKKTEKILADWSYRYLTPFGKITIIKALALSKLVHLFMSLPNPPQEFFKNLQDTFFRFIWDRGRHKISKATMYKERDEGGLKMPNVEFFCKAMKSIWIKKLLYPISLSDWQTLLTDQFNEKTCSLDLLWHIENKYVNMFTKEINSFWNEVWEVWMALKKSKEYEEPDPRTKCLWYDPHIVVGHDRIFWKSWDEAGIRFVNDLLNDEGQFLSLEEINRKTYIKINFLNYYGLLQAIPKEWKQKIKNMGNKIEEVQINKHLIFEGNIKITKLAYRVISGGNNENKRRPHEKWEADLNIVIPDWKKYFQVLYQTTSSTKLQFFQLQIIHRCLTTNTKLHYFGIKDHNRCTFCNLEKENIKHLFWECKVTRSFWLELFEWLENKTEMAPTLSEELTILNYSESKMINSLILYGKYFIYTSRCADKNPTRNNFLDYLKFKIRIEIHAEKEKAADKWNPLIEALQIHI